MTNVLIIAGIILGLILFFRFWKFFLSLFAIFMVGCIIYAIIQNIEIVVFAGLAIVVLVIFAAIGSALDSSDETEKSPERNFDSSAKQVTISRAVQVNNHTVSVYDQDGKLLFNLYGKLYGYTTYNVSIIEGNNNVICTYDTNNKIIAQDFRQ